MEALKSDPEALATKTQWDALDVYLLVRILVNLRHTCCKYHDYPDASPTSVWFSDEELHFGACWDCNSPLGADKALEFADDELKDSLEVIMPVSLAAGGAGYGM